jgi:hypothetical protein
MAGGGCSAWRQGERLLWLCLVNPELWTYVYIPDSGRFHLNKGVFVDYVWDGELTYVPIDVQEARDLIAARVGALPPEITSYQRRRYLTDEQLDAEVALTMLRGPAGSATLSRSHSGPRYP